MEGQTPNVGPRIVRAWFDTVVNPLIEALETEVRLLAVRNFTWRFRPGGFDRVRRIALHLDPRTSPNLEQLCAIYPALGAAFDDHDGSVDLLQSGVRELQSRIAGSSAFRREFETAIGPQSLAEIGVSSPAQLFGAYDREDWIQVVTQEVVNNSDHLPSYFATAKLWNLNRDKMLSILREPEIAGCYQSVTQFADKLIAVDANLLDRLRNLRLELSLREDQPFVVREDDRAQPGLEFR